MKKSELEKMIISKNEESLRDLTTLYQRMQCGMVPATEEMREKVKSLIQSILKNINEWAKNYSSLYSEHFPQE